MNPDMPPENPFENPFNQEIADLFDDWEEKNAENVADRSDLADWLADSSAEGATAPELSKPFSPFLSDEMEALFSSEQSETEGISGQLLLQLLDEDEIGDKSESEGSEDSIGLEEIGLGSEVPPAENQPAGESQDEPDFPDSPAPPLLYKQFEELEATIEQPVPLLDSHQQEPAIPFQELAALIERKISRDNGITPTAALVRTAKPGSDDFQDLEQLLEQTERALGVGSSASTQSFRGNLLRSGGRSAKNRMFEQTMRIPVKQLDNLSNLIGELVIQRNQLEQNQNRLQHFLESLLSQVQNLGDVGARTQDLYERTLLEGALLASRRQSLSPGDRQGSNPFGPLQNESPGGIGEEMNALEMDHFTGFHLLSQEVIELIVRVRESASDIQYFVDETDQAIRNLRQVTNQLQEGMTQSRMVPFAQAADRLPRAVREISLRLDKQVKLQVEGRDVAIDKMILENLYSPMTHLINNAITHGIEPPHLRRRKGKPAVGVITVRAFIQANQTVIAVADDGAGIDLNKVKDKAIKKGLISPEQAAELNNQDLHELLFYPGFTTKERADDFAGRGVGLDVVQTSLNEIRGTASIDSVPGQGTTFTIRLPLTLSICKALCCLSERARLAFPMEMVEDTRDYQPSDIQTDESGIPCLSWQGNLLPLQPLSNLLSYNRPSSRSHIYGNQMEDDTISVIIFRCSGNLLAIQVDRILGEQEIVIKQIEGPVPKPPGIAGATVLADGSILPIGDVLELLEIEQGRLRTDGNVPLWKRTAIPLADEMALEAESVVLIVDDSITVRELLSLSFSKAGYRVEQARDGQEAWEKLSAGLLCDLVFCDIEMPRMNGLELLSQIQADERLSSIPVAILTSRGADRHRQVAAKFGASAYLTKPYTEKELLDAAERMLQGEILLPGSIRKIPI